jgi:hypothetical protein
VTNGKHGTHAHVEDPRRSGHVTWPDAAPEWPTPKAHAPGATPSDDQIIRCGAERSARSSALYAAPSTPARARVRSPGAPRASTACDGRRHGGVCGTRDPDASSEPALQRAPPLRRAMHRPPRGGVYPIALPAKVYRDITRGWPHRRLPFRWRRRLGSLIGQPAVEGVGRPLTQPAPSAARGAVPRTCCRLVANGALSYPDPSSDRCGSRRRAARTTERGCRTNAGVRRRDCRSEGPPALRGQRARHRRVNELAPRAGQRARNAGSGRRLFGSAHRRGGTRPEPHNFGRRRGVSSWRRQVSGPVVIARTERCTAAGPLCASRARSVLVALSCRRCPATGHFLLCLEGHHRTTAHRVTQL